MKLCDLQIGWESILILKFINNCSWLICSCVLCCEQVFSDAIEALRISYKKMNPFCVPFATTNMGSAMLAMDLVNLLFFNFVIPMGFVSWDLNLLTAHLFIQIAGMDGAKLFYLYCLCYKQFLYNECSKPYH